MTDKAKLLAQYIRSLREDFISGGEIVPYGNMGATIIDGILQAGMRYSTVRKRVDRYLLRHSDVKTTSGFKNLIESKGVSELVDWKGPKTKTIGELTQFLVDEGVETEKDFYKWLGCDDNIARLKSLSGIGDKTADYFKILTGYDIVAIDTHLRTFLRNADIDASDDGEAKQIISEAADSLKVKKRILDNSIWRYMREEDTQTGETDEE